MKDDQPTQDTDIARALEAWSPLAPPLEFASRVLDARDADVRRPPRRARALLIGGVAIAGAAAVAVLVLQPTHRAASGRLTTIQRTTATLGDRGVVVAEPSSEVVWRVADDGAADLTQRIGNVFYRVERGGPFVVHTPAGDVRVTGTCFRIEVTPMTLNQKLLIAGLAGATVATAVVVTVYEGHVIAETRTGKTELSAGSQATLRSGDGSITASAALAASLATPTDESQATREQLLARARAQQVELVQLRARLVDLEKVAATAETQGPDIPEPGRMWHDPSPEKLASWVADCHVRVDEPSLDAFSPTTGPIEEIGLEASEVDGYNAAMSEMARRWKDLVRGLYIETTGDTAGADTLSTRAMRNEIQEKSAPGEHNLVLQHISRERAGLETPPADLSKTSTAERLMRAYVQLGDQSEAALAKRLGPERAHALRGHGWGSRHEMSGCPRPPASP